MLNIFSENLLWNKFQLFELTEIMRQKEDKTFIDALARGIMSDKDIALIKTREFNRRKRPQKCN